MKKISLVVFAMLILFDPAFAANDSATLATKNYVDQGLIYLNNKKADKDDVYTKTEVFNKDESDERYLKKVDLQNIDGTPYTADNGVVIDDHNVKLNVNAQEGAMYVYTSEGWSEMPVADEWNADIFDMPFGN